jgi:hypothetical protein
VDDAARAAVRRGSITSPTVELPRPRYQSRDCRIVERKFIPRPVERPPDGSRGDGDDRYDHRAGSAR